VHQAFVTVLLLALASISSAPVGADGSGHGRQGSPIAEVPSPAPDSVVPFGGAPLGDNALTGLNGSIVGMAANPVGGGYWLVASDGGVFGFGNAPFYGSTGNAALNRPIVGMAVTPRGGGYWLVASDGGVFSFGNAPFYGSTGAIDVNAPIVAMAPTPDGRGYWLVAADGGVFSFGDAPFYGSTGGTDLTKPVVGMAVTPRGGGYWLVAADGGVFSFGDAPFYGSTGGTDLTKPIVGMASTARGGGYWLVAADGGVFTFGDARFFGSVGGGQHVAPDVGMAATPGGNGYWLVFGPPRPLTGEVVGIDPGHNGLNYTATQVIDQQVWNGREFEDCDTTGTETAGGYTEAQFNFNVASDLRTDLEEEGAQVVMTRTNNSGIGPCVTTRAAIINNAHADVAIDIHADGGPAGGRGFAVLEPVADGPNNAVITSSASLADIVRDAFRADTVMPESTYDGVDGIEPRDDIAGLNLTTVPKVLIECGNMQNPTDAAILATPGFQESAAAAIARAITAFRTGQAAPTS
jgi:N-acetylmuramoyl-L-alanine amidase